jgi:hypothetical protein
VEAKVKFFTLDEDRVVGGYVLAGIGTYQEALEQFVPLIGGLDIQRDPLKTKFYARLEQDIVRGCVMPPITIALVEKFDHVMDLDEISAYVEKNLGTAFVLDGIQRLSTLSRASANLDFDASRSLHVNVVIAGSRDRLLYRMITLNNGQKPMSARHQIDVLSDAFFDFDEIELKLVAEKGGGRVRAPDSFKKADSVKGYIAYLSESVNIDNQKIIEEKMDELIASRIIDSDIPTRKKEFIDVVDVVNRLSKDDYLRGWIRGQNNFIGFCVGAKESIQFLAKADVGELRTTIERFETAFESINVSKVNLGKVRRETVSKLIGDIQNLVSLDEFSLLDKISDWV